MYVNINKYRAQITMISAHSDKVIYTTELLPRFHQLETQIGSPHVEL